MINPDSRCVGREICRKEMTSLMRRVLIRVANFAQYICDHFGEGTYSRIVNSLLKSHRWPVRSKTCKYIKRRAPPLDEFHSLNPHIFSIHISSSAGIAVARFWWRNPHPGEFHISSQFTYLLNHISSQFTYLLNHISSQSHIFFSGDCSSYKLSG